jgi:hypothetical protein
MDAPAVSKQRALALHYARRIVRDQQSRGVYQDEDLRLIQAACTVALEGAFHAIEWDYICRATCAMEAEAVTRFEVQTV